MQKAKTIINTSEQINKFEYKINIFKNYIEAL